MLDKFSKRKEPSSARTPTEESVSLMWKLGIIHILETRKLFRTKSVLPKIYGFLDHIPIASGDTRHSVALC